MGMRVITRATKFHNGSHIGERFVGNRLRALNDADMVDAIHSEHVDTLGQTVGEMQLPDGKFEFVIEEMTAEQAWIQGYRTS